MQVNLKNSSSTTRSFLNRFAPSLFWAGVVLCLCASLFLVRFWINSRHGVFLTTTSPDHTYAISLKGNKGRPLLIPNQVSADVSKSGQPFLSDIRVHEAWDSFDLPFEAGFPDVRWLTDNVVEFYRPEYFESGADSLQVQNEAAKPIKYMFVQAHNKFLVFDLQPGASVSLEISAPRGDSRSIALWGAFADETEVVSTCGIFDRRFRKRVRSTYKISVGNAGATIVAQ